MRPASPDRGAPTKECSIRRIFSVVVKETVRRVGQKSKRLSEERVEGQMKTLSRMAMEAMMEQNIMGKET